MSSPIEEITINCPHCQHVYRDWMRASLNLNLESFDDAYIEECGSAVCPKCQHKVNFDTLTVQGNTFYYGGLLDDKGEDDEA
jgi:endogenous inhibitor of DNA gyrase (YacG/DUF329 family)